jgi:transposase
LTRQRTLLNSQRTREIQQVEKLIESTGIKYTSVAVNVLGLSGRAFLEALIAGETNPLILAKLAKGRLIAKSEQLRLALDGNFTAHHGHLTRLHLDRIDQIDEHIAILTTTINELFITQDLDWARQLLTTIPGISTTGAENILAETGADMSAFETPAHLASWAGVCPGQHESAGRKGSSHTRPGNAHLKGALGIAAMSAARTNGSFFQNRYKRLAARRGASRAIVASNTHSSSRSGTSSPTATPTTPTPRSRHQPTTVTATTCHGTQTRPPTPASSCQVVFDDR